MKKIKIKVHKTDEHVCGHVRIDRAAELKLLQLARETGLSKRCLASQIIVQAADEVEVVEG